MFKQISKKSDFTSREERQCSRQMTTKTYVMHQTRKHSEPRKIRINLFLNPPNLNKAPNIFFSFFTMQKKSACHEKLHICKFARNQLQGTDSNLWQLKRHWDTHSHAQTHQYQEPSHVQLTQTDSWMPDSNSPFSDQIFLFCCFLDAVLVKISTNSVLLWMDVTHLIPNSCYMPGSKAKYFLLPFFFIFHCLRQVACFSSTSWNPD